MICQIVDSNGVPANDYIYTNLELAEEHCNNLVENYNEFYCVRILTPYPTKQKSENVIAGVDFSESLDLLNIL
jgi:hypothetical protein